MKMALWAVSCLRRSGPGGSKKATLTENLGVHTQEEKIKKIEEEEEEEKTSSPLLPFFLFSSSTKI